METIESTLEIHTPGVNKIASKRRTNPWFDHAAHQFNIQKKSSREKMTQKQNPRKQRKIPTNQLGIQDPSLKKQKETHKGKTLRFKYKQYKGIL